METEVLLQAAREIKEICDNADGCDECPFSYSVGRYDVLCKFTDNEAYRCAPAWWNLDVNSK